MPFRKLTTYCLAATAASALALPAAANLVLNGGFETTTLSTKGKFTENDGTGNVANWTGGQNKLVYLDFPGTADQPVGIGLIVYGPFPATSPSGGNFVMMDGDPNFSGPISQTISGLTIGASYLLTYNQAAGQEDGFGGHPTTERWSVTFGSSTQLSNQFSLPDPNGPGQPTPLGPWQSQTMTFVATATSQVLSFLAVGTPAGDPPISFLDGIDLEPVVVSAVPEPITASLFGLGLLGLGIARKRSRRRA